jgi:hypothetical protein
MTVGIHKQWPQQWRLDTGHGFIVSVAPLRGAVNLFQELRQPLFLPDELLEAGQAELCSAGEE